MRSVALGARDSIDRMWGIRRLMIVTPFRLATLGVLVVAASGCAHGIERDLVAFDLDGSAAGAGGATPMTTGASRRRLGLGGGSKRWTGRSWGSRRSDRGSRAPGPQGG